MNESMSEGKHTYWYPHIYQREWDIENEEQIKIGMYLGWIKGRKVLVESYNEKTKTYHLNDLTSTDYSTWDKTFEKIQKDYKLIQFFNDDKDYSYEPIRVPMDLYAVWNEKEKDYYPIFIKNITTGEIFDATIYDTDLPKPVDDELSVYLEDIKHSPSKKPYDYIKDNFMILQNQEWYFIK